MMRLFMVLLGLTLVAGCCERPLLITTEAGRQAFQANEVLERVENLQNAAITAYRNGALSRDTTRAIVFATVQIAEFTNAAQQDWRTMVRQAWIQAKRDLSALRDERFRAYVAALDALLGVLL